MSEKEKEIIRESSLKLGEELDSLLLKTNTELIDKFLKEKVYTPNLESKVGEELLDKDIVLKVAAEGMKNFFEGMFSAMTKI